MPEELIDLEWYDKAVHRMGWLFKELSGESAAPWGTEVIGAARDLARKGLTGRKGDPLPNLMTAQACKWIDTNPSSFRDLVSTLRLLRQCAESLVRLTPKKKRTKLQ